jgi:hypothetical protein
MATFERAVAAARQGAHRNASTDEQLCSGEAGIGKSTSQRPANKSSRASEPALAPLRDWIAPVRPAVPAGSARRPAAQRPAAGALLASQIAALSVPRLDPNERNSMRAKVLVDRAPSASS